VANRYLITGGSGFIGSHLAKRLSRFNDVYLMDLPNGDVRYSEVVNEIFGRIKPTHVIHLASIAGVDNVISRPVETMEVALLGTYNVLCASRDHNVERFIDFSTSEVFGSYAYKSGEEESTSIGKVGEARWTYAVSKLACEHLAHSFYKEFGLPTCAIRPFNIFGPGQKGQGAVHQFIQDMIDSKPLTVKGGDQIRSWCYIDDLIAGTLLCLDKEEAVGHTFNIGNPLNTCTIYQLAKMISDNVVVVPKDEVDVELRIPSIGKAQKLLGFEPKVDLEEGLRRTIEWYRATVQDTTI
jgi:UDP-glucuronate decarboxylase